MRWRFAAARSTGRKLARAVLLLLVLLLVAALACLVLQRAALGVGADMQQGSRGVPVAAVMAVTLTATACGKEELQHSAGSQQAAVLLHEELVVLHLALAAGIAVGEALAVVLVVAALLLWTLRHPLMTC